jgi:hypothetical protein
VRCQRTTTSPTRVRAAAVSPSSQTLLVGFLRHGHATDVLTGALQGLYRTEGSRCLLHEQCLFTHTRLELMYHATTAYHILGQHAQIMCWAGKLAAAAFVKSSIPYSFKFLYK